MCFSEFSKMCCRRVATRDLAATLKIGVNPKNSGVELC